MIQVGTGYTSDNVEPGVARSSLTITVFSYSVISPVGPLGYRFLHLCFVPTIPVNSVEISTVIQSAAWGPYYLSFFLSSSLTHIYDNMSVFYSHICTWMITTDPLDYNYYLQTTDASVVRNDFQNRKKMR
ncbi:hypothetical protein TNIN_317881 [Trichonephila inaurata madagascariensis]|uniref:Uncharacterized protein n=1 Tax=Trichonephila inaurata madagascariensis TaxID=2747483 RepID=A0A8X6XKA3_9ARAC|nr:hypothetical protein TNIN_317881 [Trichonephila inaurata madagascariensis]